MKNYWNHNGIITDKDEIIEHLETLYDKAHSDKLAFILLSIIFGVLYFSCLIN